MGMCGLEGVDGSAVPMRVRKHWRVNGRGSVLNDGRSVGIHEANTVKEEKTYARPS